MKTHILYIVLILALAIVAFVLYERGESYRLSSERNESVIKEKEAQIRYFETESGRQASEKLAAQQSAKEFEKNYKAMAATVQDMGIELKRLKAVVSAGFEATGSGQVELRVDTIVSESGLKMRNSGISVNDGYLKFDASWPENANTADYSYLYTDSITMVIHGEKKWLFGNETIYGTASLRNPKAMVSSQTTVLFTGKRDKRWCFGPSVYYDPLRGNYGIAVTAGYALIKF